MIYYDHGGVMVEDPSELPDFGDFDTVYMDMETTSLHYEYDSLNPWDTDRCKIHVLVIAVDDDPTIYAIPRDCIDLGWLRRVLDRSKRWVNHHVKYDAHVLQNDFGIYYSKPKVCTIAMAHVYDSDRTFTGGYGLETLSLQLLGEDISHLNKRMKPYLEKTKDYGAIPLDMLAEYGCQDVITNRKLWHFLDSKLGEEDARIRQIEEDLTSVLFDMEQRGVAVDISKVHKSHLKDSLELAKIGNQLEELIGYACNPNSVNDCFDLLCNRFGLLPVYNPETKKPSFSKEVLANYRKLEGSPVEVIDLVSAYRKRVTRCGLFWTAWDKLHVNEVLHANFNQNVRSGRMSCSKPNLQQLDIWAKEHLKPREGRAFVCRDYSQVEYRIIAHYIEDPIIMAAYDADVFADYHQVVADMGGITRPPAKTINFIVAFGGGKAVVIRALMIDPDVASGDLTIPQIQAKAEKLYRDYHRMMPGLKRKQGKAERIARQRGYIRSAYGRKLRLPSNRAHIAFNRAIQSTAADLMKYAAINCWKDEYARSKDWYLVCLVHDDFLFDVPVGDEEEAAAHFAKILHEPGVKFKVPIVSSVKSSTESWGACS